MVIIYKKHKIFRTDTKYICDNRRLFGIDGKFKKDAADRPFITSIKGAKEYITENYVREAYAKYEADLG